MNDFERTEAGNLTDEGIRQYLADRISNITKVKDQRITELKIENAKLNIILYHRENGLSHPDFKAEIEISKQSERIKELEADICPSWMGKEKGCNEARDIVELHDRNVELEAEITRLRNIMNASH